MSVVVDQIEAGRSNDRIGTKFVSGTGKVVDSFIGRPTASD